MFAPFPKFTSMPQSKYITHCLHPFQHWVQHLNSWRISHMHTVKYDYIQPWFSSSNSPHIIVVFLSLFHALFLLFLKKVFSAAWGWGLSYRAWAINQWLHIRRRIILLPFISTLHMPTVSQFSDVGPWELLPHPWWNFGGFTLFRSYAGIYGCCEFISTTTMSLSEESISQHSCPSSGSFIFFHLY